MQRQTLDAIIVSSDYSILDFAVKNLLHLFVVCIFFHLLFEHRCFAHPQVPSKELAEIADASISESRLRAHIKFLSDDLLEGRGPGTRGDDLAMTYIQSQFQALGLEPAAGSGQWIQPVPLVGVTTKPPKQIVFDTPNGPLQLKKYDDYIMTSGQPNQAAGFAHVDLVFVGYGMQAPEFDWDDFKGVNVKGKVLLIMNNDPSNDPEKFAGKTRLYYGRWDYKYAKAAERGSVAETGSTGAAAEDELAASPKIRSRSKSLADSSRATSPARSFCTRGPREPAPLSAILI